MLLQRVSGLEGALAGQVALVTGAGRGIGRETALALAHLGARILIAEISESGRETEQMIRSAGGTALFVRTDLAREEDVQRLRAEGTATLGAVDILINNATVFVPGRLWEQSVSDWDRVMAVNLRGAFLCIRAFLPAMLERGHGVVVTMESAEGMPYMAPYFASKVGLRSLALSLAQEVGEGSGVNVYCFGPGMVETPGILEALESLPGLYGLSREEFIRQSGGELLSPEVCAAGLAGTLLHAREFHGQQAGYASGLARLGLNVAGEWVGLPESAEPGEPAGPAEGPVAGPPAALELNRRLEQILEENIREYSELTIFQRPLVRLMFQQGTGLKVEEWRERARAMTLRLEGRRPESAGPDLAQYIRSAVRLAGFIQKQETDARGFFRDPAALERAITALRERHAVVTGLVRELERMA